MRRDFTDRCDDTYQLGLNRQQRRDRARATQRPGSPRGKAPVPSAVLSMALRLRETDASTLDHTSSVSDSGLEPILPTGGGADLSRGRGVLRRLSRRHRMPKVR